MLGIVARKYAHKIPFIVKINHNELLTYPNKFDQILFGTVKQSHEMGATAIGATIYFGSDESGRQIVEIAKAFAMAHELGLATILWCYLRNPKFKTKEGDMHTAADLTGQANHLGVTIEADIIKQKLPERNGGYNLLNVESAYGKTNPKIYTDLTSDNPIDLVRYQVANCFMGRAGSSTRAASRRARATWPRPSAPPSSTSAAAAWASSRAARRSSARWRRAPSSSTPSRTCTSRKRSPSRKGFRPSGRIDDEAAGLSHSRDKPAASSSRLERFKQRLRARDLERIGRIGRRARAF